MTDPDIVRRRFNELRAFTDPRAHDLLTELEELCVYAVEYGRGIQAYTATLEHEQRVRQAIDRLAEPRMAKWPNLRSVRG